MKKGLALSETSTVSSVEPRSESKGFTLIEILVVIALLSVFGTLILTIFTRTLKGSNKAQIIGMIKQNGQAVLENMDKTIRNADKVVCVENNTIVVVKDIYTRYRFIRPVAGSSNGYIQQDNPDNPSPERRESVLCQALIDTNIIIITDTNLQTGVSIKEASFKRDIKEGFKDIITIQFRVGAGEKAPAAVAGQIDPVSFQTTVQLR